MAPPSENVLVDAAASSHGDLGLQIALAMKAPIRECFAASADFTRCRSFLGQKREQVLAMLDRTRERFPHLVEELEGMAAGLEVPFLELFAYNCRSEVAAFLGFSGCSTIALTSGRRALLAHNEDGDPTNLGRMFMVRAAPPAGPRFLSCVYPGLLPGNGPSVNALGLVQTTNFIRPREVRHGIPRYFVGRAILSAQSLDEAAALAAAPVRAFAWHHNLLSLREGRCLSIEVCGGDCDVLEVRGLYMHTNHLIHPAMTRAGADPLDVPSPSSLSRLRVLRGAVAARGEPTGAAGMLALLCLHDGDPVAPCLHAAGPATSVTLAAAVFEEAEPAMTIYFGNPCEGRAQRFSL